ncbi:hypothetical protein GDO78_009004 [Eleutherodactylus coqui]|uniref:Uncharacterized protein n=1 Tax=Eleutherodactylus coqui TaxID=57060 RepID=A0A8J6FF51_ELECQ|nr:hypothetical protein GDO78_009004 [Eleutherodactylus coqui]
MPTWLHTGQQSTFWWDNPKNRITKRGGIHSNYAQKVSVFRHFRALNRQRMEKCICRPEEERRGAVGEA